MTVWIYAVDNGEFDQVAIVENGDVVEGDEEFVEVMFDDGQIPDDEAEVAKAFTGIPLVSTTDFEVDWNEPRDGRDLDDGDSGNSNLAGEHTPEWDRHYLRMLEGTAWGESDRALLAGSGVPEMVQDRLRESIMAGNIFTEFDTIPSSELMQLREYMTETLVDGGDGWTTDGLADQLMQLPGVDSRSKAENIARTETASIVNSARESAYEERGLEDAKFKWVGTSDSRTTDACTWLKEQTNPKHGGDPVTLEELRELIEEAPSHDDDMQDGLARPQNYVVHPQERHSYTRHISE